MPAERRADGSRQMRARCVVDTSGATPATKAGDGMAEFGEGGGGGGGCEEDRTRELLTGSAADLDNIAEAYLKL